MSSINYLTSLDSSTSSDSDNIDSVFKKYLLEEKKKSLTRIFDSNIRSIKNKFDQQVNQCSQPHIDLTEDQECDGFENNSCEQKKQSESIAEALAQLKNSPSVYINTLKRKPANDKAEKEEKEEKKSKKNNRN